MTETRKLTTILAADVVGCSRPTGAEEELTLARLRDLIDPPIAVHHGRVFKRTNRRPRLGACRGVRRGLRNGTDGYNVIW